MLENVMVKDSLKGDEYEQEMYLGWGFQVLDASWVGAPSKRPRRVAQNIVEEVEHLVGRTPLDPNVCLGVLGSSTPERVAPCVVAGDTMGVYPA